MAHLTFVLPGDFRSGGVRVTVIMANLLRERGHEVRIAVPRPPRFGRKALQELWLRLRQKANPNAGWLHLFRGPVVEFRRLDDLEFPPDALVIAVGTYSVAWVREMTKPVKKIRYHHGFPAKPTPSDLAAWQGRIPTITVSHTLLERLQRETEGSVWGVVPNGIETKEYYPDATVERLGVGACFNPHPNKAPEDLFWVLQELHRRRPDLPLQVFSAEAPPAALGQVTYTRLPPVDEARRIYSRCKLWLLTSRTEGLPGVVLEAMACGCVMVSSDNDGSKEVLRHEENALLVKVGDREGYVRALERLLDDEAERLRLAEQSARTIQTFTWERAADRMEEFLRWRSQQP